MFFVENSTNESRWPLLIGFLVLIPFVSQAANLQVSILEIATTNTVLPGFTTPIQSISRPSTENGIVVFAAGGQNFLEQGIYKFSAPAGLQTIVDTSTQTPNGLGNFSGFAQEAPAIRNGDVAFWGCCAQIGIFRTRMGSTQTIADNSQSIPGSTNTFTNFSDPVTDGSEVAFAGFNTNTNERGAYKGNGGALTVLADDNDVAPGGGGIKFLGFRDFAMDSGFVTFIGTSVDGTEGIYLHDGNSLSRVVDENLLFPGTADRFSLLSEGDVDNGNVVFWGRGRNFATQGIFLKPEGQDLELIVGTDTQIPGSSDNFKGIGSARIDGSNIIFSGQNNANEVGIYLSADKAISKLIDKGDTLGSSTLDQVFSVGNLDGNQFAFTAQLANGANGIYLAEITTIPIPSAAYMLISALGMLTLVRRKSSLLRLHLSA